jgi:putative transposase
MRMREIAATRVRYGFWRIYVLLRREGFADNHKRMYRVYIEEQLNLRTKRPQRNRSGAHRLERMNSGGPNQKPQSVPKRLQSHNGSEFISKEVDRWAFENHVTMDFSKPGKPTDNPYVESFNGKFRDDCLSANCIPFLGTSATDRRPHYHTVRWTT